LLKDRVIMLIMIFQIIGQVEISCCSIPDDIYE